MIVEEVIPHRIRDLLAAGMAQHDMIVRLIVEAEPAFNTSRLKVLLNSRSWAHAVNPNLIIDVNSAADQIARAETILSQLVTTTLTGKKFLDFGCGHGYAARVAARDTSLSIGYDLTKQWLDADDCVLTDDWESVVNHAPYDVALVYDVLDHSKESPIECLKKIRSVMAPDGLVVVRCHPWCSRTGNHSYSRLNKAFLHFFFSDEQLEEMGAPGIWTRRIIHPLSVYSDWFLKAKFKMITEDVKREPVEPFWEQEPFLRNLCCGQWKDSYEESLSTGEKFPKFQMEIMWYDAKLVLA